MSAKRCRRSYGVFLVSACAKQQQRDEALNEVLAWLGSEPEAHLGPPFKVRCLGVPQGCPGIIWRVGSREPQGRRQGQSR